MAHLRVLGFLATFLLCAQHVYAQTDEDRSGARAAASQAIKAFTEGRWSETVDLMARAEALVHAPTHLLYLAQAEEKQGHLVKAHEAYLKIAREQLAANAPAAFRNAHAEAEKLLEALEPRLPFVNVVALPDGAEVLAVTMDDTAVPGALVGVSHPVDPGEHVFKATAKGMESDPVTITLEEGEHKNVELTLRPSDNVPVADGTEGGSSPGHGTTGATTTSSESGASSSGGMSPYTISGIAGLGVGALGIAVGTYFLVDSSNTRSEADKICATATGECPSDQKRRVQAIDDDADTAQKYGWAGLIVGGVSALGGAALLALGANDDSVAQSTTVKPYFGLGTLGVTGRF